MSILAEIICVSKEPADGKQNRYAKTEICPRTEKMNISNTTGRKYRR